MTRTNDGDKFTGRDRDAQADRKDVYKTPPVHSGMAHQNGPTTVLGLSRTQGQDAINALKGVNTNPTLNPAEKNLQDFNGEMPPEPHPGMTDPNPADVHAKDFAGIPHRTGPAAYVKDVTSDLGGRILDEGRRGAKGK